MAAGLNWGAATKLQSRVFSTQRPTMQG